MKLNFLANRLIEGRRARLAFVLLPVVALLPFALGSAIYRVAGTVRTTETAQHKTAANDGTQQALYGNALPAGIPDLSAIARDPAARAAYFTAIARLKVRARERARQAAVAWAQLERDGIVSRKGRLFPTPTGQLDYKIELMRSQQFGDPQAKRSMSVRWTGYGKRFHFERKTVSAPDSNDPIWRTWIIGDKHRLTLLPGGRGFGGYYGPAQPGQPRQVLQAPRPADLSRDVGRALWFLPPANMIKAHHQGTERVLGRPCAIYTLNEQDYERSVDSKLWIWCGLVLRAEMIFQFWGGMRPADGGTPITVRRSFIATRLATTRPTPHWFKVPSGHAIEKVNLDQLPLR